MMNLNIIVLEIAQTTFGNDILLSDIIPKNKLSYEIFCSAIGEKFDISIQNNYSEETLQEVIDRIHDLIKGY